MGYHPSNIVNERKKHQIIKLTNDLAVPIVRTDCLLFNSRLAAEDAIRVALVDNMFISMYSNGSGDFRELLVFQVFKMEPLD